MCGETSSPTRAQEAVSALQWIGTNSEPGCWPSLTTTLSTQAPCGVETRAKPPSARPATAASRGCTSTNGSGRCVASRALMPVRVIVCHWSRMRPVLSRNGNASEVASRNAGGSGATKRALRSGVKKPPAAKKRLSLGGSPARSGHWTGASVS